MFTDADKANYALKMFAKDKEKVAKLMAGDPFIKAAYDTLIHAAADDPRLPGHDPATLMQADVQQRRGYQDRILESGGRDLDARMGLDAMGAPAGEAAAQPAAPADGGAQ